MTSDSENADEFALAAYLPRAFCIELKSHVFDSQARDGHLEFSPEAFPIFMHEVAHLVQDRSTFRGVIDFLDFWDRVSAISERVRVSDQVVEIPFFDFRTGASRLGADLNWAVATDQLRRFRELRNDWDSDGRAWAFSRYEVTWLETRIGTKRVRYPVVTVFLVDNVTHEQYQHTLGAWEIKEAYSVAVGMIHGGAQPEFGSQDFEYLAVERILTHFFGRVTPRQIVALCHWCLQDLAPGNSLFALIEHFDDEGGLPDAETIYRYARFEAMGRGFERNVQDVLNNVQQYAKVLGQQNKSLGVLFNWYHEHAEKLVNLHLDGTRLFPLDTFLCDADPYASADVQDKGLKNFVSEVEIPLITWPNGDTFSISGNSGIAASAVQLNQAVFHLSNQLWASMSSTWECPIYGRCDLQMKDDIECTSTPWKKVRHSPLCPYGAAAKIIDLNDFKEIRVSPIAPTNTEES